MNNLILVGRVVEDPELVTLESGYKVARLVLAIQRPFRNENNEYDVDYIPVQTWMGLAEIVCDYAGKGSIVGFKCRLSTHLVEIGETKLKSIDVIGERISFIKTYPPASAKKETKNLSFEDSHPVDAMINSEYASDVYTDFSDESDVEEAFGDVKQDFKEKSNIEEKLNKEEKNKKKK